MKAISLLHKPAKYYAILERKLKRKANLQRLKNRNYTHPISLRRIWSLANPSIAPEPTVSFNIFGTDISLDEINWHLDIPSGHSFTPDFIDGIALQTFADRGIDVKFPWEISRFYFAVSLAQEYHVSQNPETYLKFKSLVLDWIDKNSFLYGVNWYCTMEVAIRATNWIVAASIFGDILTEDIEFADAFSISLTQHADYIQAFPEISQKGHSTNHTTADYAGLLFLAIALHEHKSSQLWLDTAVDGLEECIRYQVRNDGGHFESSIPYHRLVLELLAYSALVANANDVALSDTYWRNLRKMFSYTAQYIDLSGTAPMVGDNDSGRFLIFEKPTETNHYYLLVLGKHLFGVDILENQRPQLSLMQWWPQIEPRPAADAAISSIGCFWSKDSGAYSFRTKSYRAFVSAFPLGMNGQGGHNHLDAGSIVLTVNGKDLLLDLGSYTYTRSLSKRKEYRAPQSHNNIVTDAEQDEEYSNGYWDIKNFPQSTLETHGRNEATITVKNHLGETKTRKIIFHPDQIEITDQASHSFSCLWHSEHNCQPASDGKSITIGDQLTLTFSVTVSLQTASFSPQYGVEKQCKKMVVKASANEKVTTLISISE